MSDEMKCTKNIDVYNIPKPKITKEQQENFNFEEYQVKKFNSSVKFDDIYECKLCGNKGMVAYINENGKMAIKECKCKKIRDNRRKMKQVGLFSFIKTTTIKNIVPKEEWEKTMFRTAKQYIQEEEPCSVFYGGAVGCGKTTICANIMLEEINKNPNLTADYILWDTDYKDLVFNDKDHIRLNELKKAGILMIDDFLRQGRIKEISDTEREVAKSLIDYRYRNELITIITSELPLTEIVDIDEAIGTRIYQMCKKGQYVVGIKSDKNRNHRMQEDDIQNIRKLKID